MKYLMFGEMMLRLRAPRFERLFQSYELEATFAGSEANVAVSLANYGEEAYFVTIFPENNIVADSAERELRKFGVKTDKIVYSDGRFGVYYIEQGSNLLPNKTYYDRDFSSMCMAGPGHIDWDDVFKDIDWFHVSGITSAISQSASDLNLEAVKIAREKGIIVSCDINYRGNLWNYGKSATEVIPELVKNVDVLIASEGEIDKCLSINSEYLFEKNMQEFPRENYIELNKRCMEEYPNLKYIAMFLQKNYSADSNLLCSTIFDGDSFYKSIELKSENIIDRVGVGDAIASGIIYGINNYENLQDAVDFGIAAGTLKGSIVGDFNRVSKVDVENVMKGASLEQKR